MTRNYRAWKIVLFAALPLTTGAALVAYIVARISLLLGVVLAFSTGLALALLVWQRANPNERQIVLQRARVGVVAGLIGTLGYDASRYVFVNVLHLSFWPFDIYSIFGGLLLGSSAPLLARDVVGVVYHYANGIGFALAFIFLFRRPTIWKGWLWAGVLELFMISLYPGWLGLKALDELLSVSIVGHLVYGASIGLISSRVRRSEGAVTGTRRLE